MCSQAEKWKHCASLLNVHLSSVNWLRGDCSYVFNTLRVSYMKLGVKKRNEILTSWGYYVRMASCYTYSSLEVIWKYAHTSPLAFSVSSPLLKYRFSWKNSDKWDNPFETYILVNFVPLNFHVGDCLLGQKLMLKIYYFYVSLLTLEETCCWFLRCLLRLSLFDFRKFCHGLSLAFFSLDCGMV